MSKYVYTATCPDGTIVKRTTDRVYTHAVVGYWKDEEVPTYGMFEFCGRPDLAQKSCKKWTAQGAKVVIVPVDNPRPEPTETAAPEPTPVSATIAEYTHVDKKVQSGVTPEESGFYAFVTVNGLVVDGQNFVDRYLAMQWAKTQYEHYTAPEPTPAQPESARIKLLREKIERNERELVSLRYELEQLLGL